MNRDDPLTPEERELARLLGRRAEQSPPPALDAAILAAARAAVDAPAGEASLTPTAPRTLRPRRRWPAVFGVAASTVFAVGIAWQMRPEPPSAPAEAVATAPAAQEMAADASAEVMASDSASADVVAAETAPAPTAATAPAAAEAAPASAAAIADVPKPAPVTPRQLPAPMMAPAPPPAPAADTAFAAPAMPAAAPAAPEAYSMPAPASAPAAPAAAMRARKATAATAESMSSAQATTEDRIALTAAKQDAAGRTAPGVMRRASDAGLSAEAVQAEVQADAGLPRRQWLQKIRERRDCGQRDLARASLERYLQTYPEARLPKDVRPLLDD
ncbi:MAG: hypothetical protein ACN6PX_17405 [Stenotrophomonas lactitubi]|uniref:hypothetical protein n=1 Tax=Stenotrophomonas lactitubi TaxID=2045214 RepID=UPI003D0EB69F